MNLYPLFLLVEFGKRIPFLFIFRDPLIFHSAVRVCLLLALCRTPARTTQPSAAINSDPTLALGAFSEVDGAFGNVGHILMLQALERPIQQHPLPLNAIAVLRPQTPVTAVLRQLISLRLRLVAIPKASRQARDHVDRLVRQSVPSLAIEFRGAAAILHPYQQAHVLIQGRCGVVHLPQVFSQRFFAAQAGRNGIPPADRLLEQTQRTSVVGITRGEVLKKMVFREGLIVDHAHLIALPLPNVLCQLTVSHASHVKNAFAHQRKLAAELLRQAAQGIHHYTGFLQGGFLTADTRQDCLFLADENTQATVYPFLPFPHGLRCKQRHGKLLILPRHNFERIEGNILFVDFELQHDYTSSKVCLCQVLSIPSSSHHGS